MSTDGKILAAARKKLEEKKALHEAELERRRETAFSLAPELQSIERELRQIAAQAAMAALSKREGAPGAIGELGKLSLSLQKRQAELLESLGFGGGYLDESPMCAVCGDTGFTRDGMCRCLNEIYKSEAICELSSLLRLGEETFETFRLGYYDSKADPKTGVSPRECMETILETCKAFAYRFGSHGMNLVFQGLPGLGKTFLSSCIAREVSKKGFSVVYDTAVSVFDAFQTERFSKDTQQSQSASGTVRRYLHCDLLIIDDLGTEFSSPLNHSALYTIISTRGAENRRTIISTNLSREGLYVKYTPQIMSRLEGEYEWQNFTGSDIRLLKNR